MARQWYVGTAVTVSFDPEICQHSGVCVRGLGAVFGTTHTPWIQPDGATAEEVVTQVGRCPSGALRIEPREPSA